MLAACLGRPRGEDIDDLAELRMGVRADQPGMHMMDYHTLWREELPTASGGVKRDSTVVTERWYLADAVFVVTLTGGRSFLQRIADAIDDPVYAPVLGRRSCIPTGRINLGVYDNNPEVLLAEWPWQAGSVQLAKTSEPPMLDVTIEDPAGADVVPDVPANYAPLRRSFGNRRVRHFTVTPPHPNPPADTEPESIDHDTFELLEP